MNSRYFKVVFTMLVVSVTTLLYGCGSQPVTTATSIPPTFTPVPPIPPTSVPEPTTNNSREAISLLNQAQQATRDARTYHFTVEMFGIYDGRRGTAEGDVSTTDGKVRIKYDNLMMGHGEKLIFDGGKDVYLMRPEDPGYIAFGSSDNISPGAIAYFLDPLQFSGHSRTTRDARLAGEEKLDGLSTSKVTYTVHDDYLSLNANEVPLTPLPTQAQEQLTIETPRPAGIDATVEVWIEKGTNYILMFRELKRYNEKDFPGIPASPGPGGAAGMGSATWPMTWTFSEFNKEINPPIEKPTNIMPTPIGDAIPSP